MQRKQLIFNIIVMVFLLGRVSLVPLQAQPYKNAKLSPDLGSRFTAKNEFGRKGSSDTSYSFWTYI